MGDQTTLRPEDQAVFDAASPYISSYKGNWTLTGWKVNSDGTTSYQVTQPRTSSPKEGPTTVDVPGLSGDDDTNGGPLEQKWYTAPVTSDLDKAIRTAVTSAKTPAVKTYFETESDKASEATRQFKDFLERAKGVYDLRESEQKYAMNADDQNVQNLKNAREGLGIYPGDYTVPTMNTAYSRILAASMPNSVKGIYYKDAAVGLGPLEGLVPSQNPNPIPGSVTGNVAAASGTNYSNPPPTPSIPSGQDENGLYWIDPITNEKIYEQPQSYAYGTDYKAMLMRKLITGGL